MVEDIPLSIDATQVDQVDPATETKVIDPFTGKAKRVNAEF